MPLAKWLLPPQGPTPPRPRAGSARRRRAPGAFLAALAALAVVPGSGCQNLNSLNPISLWHQGFDSSLSKPPTAAETGPDDRNLMARWLSPKKPPAGNYNADPLVLGSDGWRPMKPVPNPEADKEFQDAETLFQQGKLTEAAAAFTTLAEKRKGTPWGEKGQYYLAETQFQQSLYVHAHDSYEKLMTDYSGTDYTPKAIQREYAIAQKWLAQTDPKTSAREKFPWDARFKGVIPLIDTHGHALRVLEHVRHHSPDGELADTATLRMADEAAAASDYETAAIYYDQLITEHPKSPFLQRAQLASIDAKMKGYIGPEYDGAGLDKARDLIRQTMQTFPDRPTGNEKLYHALDLINDQQAERVYIRGEYYRRAGYPESAEFYFAQIPQQWPKSPWAVKAKTQLASLAKVPRKLHDPSKIMTQPGSTDPMLGGMGGMNGMGMGGMNGMGMGGMGGMNGMN